MEKNLDREIRENQILVIVIPNESYQKSLLDIVEDLAKNYKSVCYVSLNKPYSVLLKMFDQRKINSKNFFFIDCVSKKVEEADAKRVLRTYSPSALTELSIAINKVLEMSKTDAIVFDSLSTLLIYEEPMNAIKFTQDIITRIRLADAKGIFTILRGDDKTELMNDVNMFCDRILVL